MAQPLGTSGSLPEQFQKRFDDLQQQMMELQKSVEELSATATSDDKFVEATVGARGELRELHLDPRIYRDTNAEKLARTIAETIWEATRLVTEQLVELAAPSVPNTSREELHSALLNVPEADGDSR